jgi:hypothetical protein
LVIQKIIKANRGYAICKCDYCGKEIKKSLSKLHDKHYCNNNCASMIKMSNKFGIKTYKNVRADCHCIVCGKPYDDSFYDKGDRGRADNGGQRYLCSKTYRDISSDTLDNINIRNNKNIYINEANRKVNKLYL